MRATPTYVAMMLLLPTAAGFGVLVGPTKSAGYAWRLHQASSEGSKTAEEPPHHIEYNPMAGYQSVDLERAKACAEHFGECSVEEMASLRENLHKERMQRFMFGNVDPRDTMREMEESLEHRLLEEELDLQLAMLRDQNELHGGGSSGAGTASSVLFPMVDEYVAEVLPQPKTDREAVEVAELTHALEETVLEESNLEAIALCAGIALLLAFPHLLQL